MGQRLRTMEWKVTLKVVWELRIQGTYLVHFPQLPRQKEKQGQAEQGDHSEVE